MIISPHTMELNNKQGMAIYSSLKKVNKLLRKNIEENGELDGLDSIIDCIAENAAQLAEQFEFLKYWAEDANVQIHHERLFGNGVKLDIQEYTRSPHS